MPAGRPSTYTPELAAMILERMSEGEFVQEICAEEGMPHVGTLWRWREARPEFREAYARARLAQADAIAERGFLRAWNAKDAQIDRLAFDAAKWISAKLDPRNYGDKQVIAGDADAPVKTETKVTVEIVRPSPTSPRGV